MLRFTIRELVLTIAAVGAGLVLLWVLAVYGWYWQPESKSGRVRQAVDGIAAKAEEARRLVEESP